MSQFFLWVPDPRLKGRAKPCVLEQLPSGQVNVYALEDRDSPLWYQQNGAFTPLAQPAEQEGLTGESKPDTMTPQS